MKKLIYEVFQHTDISPELEPTADIYSDGSVVSRLYDSAQRRMRLEKISAGDANKLKELQESDKKVRDEYQVAISSFLLEFIKNAVLYDLRPWEELESVKTDLSFSKHSIPELIVKYKPFERRVETRVPTWFVNERHPIAFLILDLLGYVNSYWDTGIALKDIPVYSETPPMRLNRSDSWSTLNFPENAAWVEYLTKYYGEGAPMEVEPGNAKDLERAIESSNGEGNNIHIIA